MAACVQASDHIAEGVDVSSAVRWAGKSLAVGAIVALSVSGCSGEATRSALGDEAVKTESSSSQEASPSSSTESGPSSSPDARPSSSATTGVFDDAEDTSAEDDASAPALSGSSETPSSEESGQPLGGSGPAVNCPNRALSCRAWPERPASEGWVEDVLCPDRRSFTRAMELHNLTTVRMVVAIRGIDCDGWAVTGNPGQITGTRLEPGATGPARWLLEPANSDGRKDFDIGVFIRNRDGSLDYRGVAKFAGSWSTLTSLFESENGELLYQTNTGRVLRPQSEGGYVCVRQSLGADPNEWRTNREFKWGPLNLGKMSSHVSIYSDGATLYAVQCRRGDTSDF